jgi:hypothetical protein
MSKRLGDDIPDDRAKKKVKTIKVQKPLRFEDYLKLKKKNMKKKPRPKKSSEDQEDFDTFHKMDLNQHDVRLVDYKQTDNELQSVFDLSLGLRGPKPRLTERNKITFDELVSFVFDNATLDALIEFNVNDSLGLPKLFYKRDQSMLSSDLSSIIGVCIEARYFFFLVF